jgi:RNA polymerase sigma factor (sigma-70 family)
MECHSLNSSISEQNRYVIGQCVSAMNDELLVSAARSGDVIAFNELYARHARKVLPRIYSITKNREDAEDVLQEAAMRAFLHIKSFEGRSSFLSWLTRIAINSALMVLRKRRSTEISIEQMSDDECSSRPWEPCDNTETPEAHYARCERETLLMTAIQRLPFIFREIIELQRTDEYSTTQIAEELGISLSAAKSRLMRARKSLRRLSRSRIPSGLKSASSRDGFMPRIHSNSGVHSHSPRRAYAPQ